jgi:hypothetical protein
MSNKKISKDDLLTNVMRLHEKPNLLPLLPDSGNSNGVHSRTKAYNLREIFI